MVKCSAPYEGMRLCVYVFMRLCACLSMRLCMCVYAVYVCLCVCVCVSMRLCMCVYVAVCLTLLVGDTDCMYMCTYIHTVTHERVRAVL